MSLRLFSSKSKSKHIASQSNVFDEKILLKYNFSLKLYDRSEQRKIFVFVPITSDEWTKT